jgi:hypothetical protein
MGGLLLQVKIRPFLSIVALPRLEPLPHSAASAGPAAPLYAAFRPKWIKLRNFFAPEAFSQPINNMIIFTIQAVAGVTLRAMLTGCIKQAEGRVASSGRPF